MERNNEKSARVLVLIDWYLPGYKAGGPAQSVANLVERLKKYVSFHIITRANDLGETQPYTSVELNKWTKEEDNVNIYYISSDQLMGNVLLNLLRETPYDVLYMNSLFSFHFTSRPLWFTRNRTEIRRIVAPRGMIAEGALQIKSIKKQLFLWGAKFIGLYKNVIWQATNKDEVAEIKAMLGSKCKIVEANNIPRLVPDGLNGRDKVVGVLKMVFLSRIDRIKNLNQVLQLLKSIGNEAKIELDIYGPIKDAAYWMECEKIVPELPKNIAIQYKGTITPDRVNATLSNYHLFILLTKHENFGHVIFEALASGCPVLISDATPWRNLKEKGIGWDINLQNTEALKNALTECLRMNQIDFDALSLRAHNFTRMYQESDISVKQYQTLFHIKPFEDGAKAKT